MSTWTIPCPTEIGCYCGTPPECTLCNGYTELGAFSTAYNFPSTQTPDSSFPFNYSGANLSGITLWLNSDIIVDSSGGDTYLVRAGCGNLGPPYSIDDAWMYFTGVTKRNVTFSYEYYLQDSGCVSGGKHRVLWIADTSDLTTGTVQIGSWSNNFSNSRGLCLLQAEYDIVCQPGEPPPEIPDLILPQAKGEWRTRTIIKNNDSILYTDGDVGPIEIGRCWLPLNGTIGMMLGPGVRIRNISITL